MSGRIEFSDLGQMMVEDSKPLPQYSPSLNLLKAIAVQAAMPPEDVQLKIAIARSVADQQKKAPEPEPANTTDQAFVWKSTLPKIITWEVLTSVF